MKKVSFIKGYLYSDHDLDILSSINHKAYFDYEYGPKWVWRCNESFTAEITVKILPYEES